MHGGGLYTTYMHKTSRKTNKLDSTKKTKRAQKNSLLLVGQDCKIVHAKTYPIQS